MAINDFAATVAGKLTTMAEDSAKQTSWYYIPPEVQAKCSLMGVECRAIRPRDPKA
jgi:hypothetical protein